jgi:hypothetical protein
MYSTICPKCWDGRGEGAIVPAVSQLLRRLLIAVRFSTLLLLVVVAASVLMRTKGKLKCSKREK